MTTSDKRPRRTTKTAKAAKAARTEKAPDTGGGSEDPTNSHTAGTADAPKAASAAKTARPAKVSSASGTAGTPAAEGALRGETAPAADAGVRRAENGAGIAVNAASTGAGRIRAISVSVTSRYHEDRHASIALAAYFRSESRGFAPGHEVEDWLAAEEEVDQRLLGEGRAS